MKNSILGLVFGILLVSSIGMVIAAGSCETNNDCELKDTPYCCAEVEESYSGCYNVTFTPEAVNCTGVVVCPGIELINTCECVESICTGSYVNVCDSDNLDLCINEDSCEDIGRIWENDECTELIIPICGPDNLDLCINEDSCEDAGGDWENNICEEEEESEEEVCEDLSQTDCDANSECTYYANDKGKGNVDGWCKKAGWEDKGNGKDKNKKGPQGYAFGYRFRLQDRNISFHEFKEIIMAEFGNKTEDGEEGEVKVYLSNGRKANLKIMPNVASNVALARLRLRNCNEENNCSIELKEVGKGEGNKTRAAYEIQIQRHHKLLGIFRIKAMNRVQIDAETGEIIKVKKPWWAFLATEEDEVEEDAE
tara:strand:- start:408 stop:1508 length:1101 start_codon:yes stop_codon:yes gene_type:complete